MGVKNQLSIVTNSVLDIIYPNQCAICNTDLNHTEHYLCFICKYDLPYLKQDDFIHTQLKKLFWGRVEISNIFSLLNYQKGNQTQKLLHLLKYNNKNKLAQYFGEMLGNVITNKSIFDLIIPVPLHPKKKRIRGYNQSTIIAKGINQKLNGVINENLLIRNNFNFSQTNFSKYDRWENVSSIFEVVKPKKIKNKHILLVDDVLTTGATIEACVKELLKIEGCKVSIATLAARI